jgi:L-amino acid N-acyltransferase YncA
MNVRGATVDDSAQLAHIQVESYRNTYSHAWPQEYMAQITLEDQTQDWIDLLSSDETTDLIYVVEVDGKILGYGIGRLMDEGAAASEIVAVHILKDKQGQGIGGQLVKVLAQHLRDAGCASTMAWVLDSNTRSRTICERIGGRLGASKRSQVGENEFITEVSYVWDDIDDIIKRE